jgi:hypothetical protein
MGKKLFFAVILVPFFSVLLAAESNRPIVTDISAEPQSATRIEISWTIPRNADIKALLVFRSTQPFVSRNQLDDKTLIAKLKADATGYTDTLKTYREYYYAVIAFTTTDTRYDILLPSVNATINGVRVKRIIAADQKTMQSESGKEKLYPPGQMREVPLPYLDLIADQDKKPGVFSPSAVAAAQELAANCTDRQIVPLEPYIFNDDMQSPPGGDDYFLFDILKSSFVQKHYRDSSAALEKLLSSNRSSMVTNRGTFYLGESYYFQGNYQSAITAFLKVEDTYPVLAKKWLESALDLYHIPQAN